MKKKYKKFFEDELWKEAFDLQKCVFELTRRFPKEENYGLVSQLERSANSIMANIAEADGRYHYADKIRVLYIARGELQETQSHLLCAVSRNYLNKEDIIFIINRYEKIKKMLNGKISNFWIKKDK